MLRNNRKKLIMWLILFIIVVNSPNRKSEGAVLLEDDFSGNVIDISIWTVTTADSGYVFQENGLIVGGVEYGRAEVNSYYFSFSKNEEIIVEVDVDCSYPEGITPYCSTLLESPTGEAFGTGTDRGKHHYKFIYQAWRNRIYIYKDYETTPITDAYYTSPPEKLRITFLAITFTGEEIKCKFNNLKVIS